MPVGPRVKDGLRRTGGYLPIEGYGLIGDCRSAALVGLDGSIDFLCLPRFDSDAVFSRILDATRGGCWEIRPAVTFSSRQHYRDRTNLLDSIFTTGTGIVALTDYMPVDERDVEAQGRFRDEPRIVRHVECLAGHVRMRHVYDPRPGFAREQVALTVESDRHVHADAGRLRLCLTSTVDLGPGDTTFTLRAGEAVYCALAWGTRLASETDPTTAAEVLQRKEAPALTAREKALATWAGQVVREPNAITAADVDRLRSVLANVARLRSLKEDVGSLRTELRKFGSVGSLPTLQVKFGGDLAQMEDSHAEATLQGASSVMRWSGGSCTDLGELAGDGWIWGREYPQEADWLRRSYHAAADLWQ